MDLNLYIKPFVGIKSIPYFLRMHIFHTERIRNHFKHDKKYVNNFFLFHFRHKSALVYKYYYRVSELYQFLCYFLQTSF